MAPVLCEIFHPILIILLQTKEVSPVFVIYSRFLNYSNIIFSLCCASQHNLHFNADNVKVVGLNCSPYFESNSNDLKIYNLHFIKHRNKKKIFWYL